MQQQKKNTTGFEPHNHNICIAQALHTAQIICEDKSLKFTTSRRRVLEILLENHTAMGAYDILGRLGEEGIKSQPPVVYRALDFLIKNNFVHKIEQLNAFIACCHSDHNHFPVFMICRICCIIAEVKAPQAMYNLKKQAVQNGFLIEKTLLEVSGVCPNCQKVS